MGKIKNRIIGCHRVLRADNVILLTIKDGKADHYAYGFDTELSDLILITIQIKKMYNQFDEILESAAEEMGELPMLVAMRKAIEDNDRGRD